MWSNQPTPTTTEHSSSVSTEKITPQQSHPAFWHQTEQRFCSAHTQLWFGREANTWKVNDRDWVEVAAGIQARSRSQCSMRDSWTVCSALNAGTLHVIFLKVNITIFSYILWQSRELWVCGDSAVGDINPTEKAGWHIFYTVSSNLSLHFLHRLREAERRPDAWRNRRSHCETRGRSHTKV